MVFLGKFLLVWFFITLLIVMSVVYFGTFIKWLAVGIGRFVKKIKKGINN